MQQRKTLLLTLAAMLLAINGGSPNDAQTEAQDDGRAPTRERKTIAIPPDAELPRPRRRYRYRRPLQRRAPEQEQASIDAAETKRARKCAARLAARDGRNG